VALDCSLLSLASLFLLAFNFLRAAASLLFLAAASLLRLAINLLRAAASLFFLAANLAAASLLFLAANLAAASLLFLAAASLFCLAINLLRAAAYLLLVASIFFFTLVMTYTSLAQGPPLPRPSQLLRLPRDIAFLMLRPIKQWQFPCGY
jgi:hypothetical protein